MAEERAHGRPSQQLDVLFIVVPIGLVMKRFYVVSFIVFVFMVPYGFLMRYLAVRAVRRGLELNIRKRAKNSEQAGIFLTKTKQSTRRNPTWNEVTTHCRFSGART